jgi:hypothetical protein
MNVKVLLRVFSIIYFLIFITCYAVVPYFFLIELFPKVIPLLIELTIISVIFTIISMNFSTGYILRRKLISIDFDLLINLTFSVFLFLVFIIMVTAPSIPIIESLKGASEQELSIYRESFLKARTGWEQSLGYFIEIINGALLPYLIAYSFIINHKNRKWYALIFLVYCMSFLAKAYFLKLAIPLFFVFLERSKNKFLFILKGSGGIITLIFLMYTFAGKSGTEVNNNESFFSTLYLPTSTFDAMLWRSLIIPIMTAVDGFNLFINDLNSNFMYGDTSSFIAFFKGNERINFERMIYQSQFGGSETGNSNAYFLVEAYVNYGYLGVILFSIFIGRIMRNFILKKDIALVAILPLFLLNLYSAGLISLLLSGGYLVLYILVNNFKIKNNEI